VTGARGEAHGQVGALPVSAAGWADRAPLVFAAGRAD
jgi:hypothetical protein